MEGRGRGWQQEEVGGPREGGLDPAQERPVIAPDTEQRMESLAERLETLRGYL